MLGTMFKLLLLVVQSYKNKQVWWFEQHHVVPLAVGTIIGVGDPAQIEMCGYDPTLAEWLDSEHNPWLQCKRSIVVEFKRPDTGNPYTVPSSLQIHIFGDYC